MYQKVAHHALLFACVSGLYGCGDTPVKKAPDPVVAPDTQPIMSQGTLDLPPSQFSPQFNTAEQYLLTNDWMAAINTLASIEPEETSATDRQYISYMQARIQYLRGDQGQAAESIARLLQATIDPAIGNKAHNFQRYMLSMSGHYLDSARLGDRMLGQLSPGQPSAIALKESIWEDLQRLHSEELQLAFDSTTDLRWQGWLALSLLTADSPGEVGLRDGLARWVYDNPTHPANRLPGGLSYLLDESSTLQKVVLMLPLSGRLAPAAKAVRDGYLANYYTSTDSGKQNFELQIMDLDRYPSAIQAYEEAASTGANLVVGPLSKQNVAALGGHPGRRVPVLALNRVERAMPAGDTALVQLALSPEDEAAQIAELAFGRGARRAMLVRPAGSWGTKMEQALHERWSGLGGEIAGIAVYSSQEDYSSSTAAALNLSESEQRARDIRSMLATNIEFTPRRRQDLDAIFLLARNGAEARSLKPLLDYHYAADLPVYATTSIYRGVHDGRDGDLNGVQLVETPWLLGGNPGLYTELDAAGNYTRLYALGADAYLLQTRFRQLQAGPDVRIRGNTGLLSLDPHLRIRRELQAATFDGSVLVAQ